VTGAAVQKFLTEWRRVRYAQKQATWAVDSARRRELGSLDEMRMRGDADSGSEIPRIPVFRYETSGISWAAE
jgi:hypothetical protein